MHKKVMKKERIYFTNIVHNNSINQYSESNDNGRYWKSHHIRCKNSAVKIFQGVEVDNNNGLIYETLSKDNRTVNMAGTDL